jgi:hypothetical protein
LVRKGTPLAFRAMVVVPASGLPVDYPCFRRAIFRRNDDALPHSGTETSPDRARPCSRDRGSPVVAAGGPGPAVSQEAGAVDPDSLRFQLVEGLEVADRLTYRSTPSGEDGDLDRLRGVQGLPPPFGEPVRAAARSRVHLLPRRLPGILRPRGDVPLDRRLRGRGSIGPPPQVVAGPAGRRSAPAGFKRYICLPRWLCRQEPPPVPPQSRQQALETIGRTGTSMLAGLGEVQREIADRLLHRTHVSTSRAAATAARSRGGPQGLTDPLSAQRPATPERAL